MSKSILTVACSRAGETDRQREKERERVCGVCVCVCECVCVMCMGEYIGMEICKWA